MYCLQVEGTKETISSRIRGVHWSGRVAFAPSSMSSSFETVYRPIPQAPVAANPVILSELENDVSGVDDSVASTDHPLVSCSSSECAHDLNSIFSVDSRIRLIHFILGCSVLLPWNGSCCLSQSVRQSDIDVVMITATPFFVSRLSGSDLQLTFSSYLSCSFTASNFMFLAHATISSRQVRLSFLYPVYWLRSRPVIAFTSNSRYNTVSLGPYIPSVPQYIYTYLSQHLLRFRPSQWHLSSRFGCLPPNRNHCSGVPFWTNRCPVSHVWSGCCGCSSEWSTSFECYSFCLGANQGIDRIICQ